LKEGLGPPRVPKPVTGRGRAPTLTKAQPGWTEARRKPMETSDSAFGLGLGRMAPTLRETERAINSGVTVTSDTRPLDDRHGSRTLQFWGRCAETLKHRSPCAGRQRSGTDGPRRRNSRGPTLAVGRSDAELPKTTHSRASLQGSLHMKRETLASTRRDVFFATGA